MNPVKTFLLLAIVMAFVSCSSGEKVSVESIYTELKISPAGIQTRHPSFSWNLTSEIRNIFQSAYHILVADDPGYLKDNERNIWNAGKVFSERSLHILYIGAELQPATTYYWKVRVWCNDSLMLKPKRLILCRRLV